MDAERDPPYLFRGKADVRLRDPHGGCPWDRDQDFHSIAAYTLEEAYEVVDAIEHGDPELLCDELGDLLFQVVFHARMAEERGWFGFAQVAAAIANKLERRHPHVFGDLELDGVDGVLVNWEKLKEKERGKKKEDKGILDGVPISLPALSQAQEYQDRAARVGFDWPEIEGVLDKIAEEIEEVRQATDETELTSELGDLLFALVNLARWKKVDAESALRGTNMKFKKRFGYVEKGAKAQGRDLSSLTLAEMDALWNEAKTKEL